MYRSLFLAIAPVVVSILPCMGASVAGHGAIGLAMANGEFIMNTSTVRGNASVLEGSTIQTLKSPSHITLQNGTRLDLTTDSRVQIYNDRLVLNKGVSQIQGSGYTVQASNLQVSGDSQSRYRVSVQNAGKVLVSSSEGRVDVKNARGILLARVLPGSAFEFNPQDTGAAGPAKFTGCIQRTGGRYVLRDEATNAVVEVTGPDVAANLGKSVEVTGSVDSSATPVSGASQLVHASAVTALGRHGCKTDIGSAAAAAGAAGAAAATAGLSAGATAAIVGGVAAAATIGGLAAAGTFSGGDENPSSVF